MENLKNDEELKFKNTSKMDDEEISLFQNFALKKTTIISSIVFALIFAGLGVGLSFVDMTLGITLIVCGLLGGFVLLPYLMKESLKKQNKQNLGDKKYLNTFEFYESYILITSEANSSENKNEYQPIANQKLFYADIYKIVAYKEHLFIYINPHQSFILNYKGMTKGTAGEIIELAKEKNIKLIDKSYADLKTNQKKK